MGAAAELGKNPVSKRQIQPEYGNEQADAGRDRFALEPISCGIASFGTQSQEIDNIICYYLLPRGFPRPLGWATETHDIV